MTALWRKTLRDLWLQRARAVLVVLAIALGIAGLTASLSSYAILVRELNRGYLRTDPASAVVRTDRVDAALVSAVLAFGDLAAAEPRRLLAGRIKAGPARWRPLTLIVVEDFANLRVSKLEPQQGAWPPAAGEILIERDALQVLGAGIGATVTLRTARGHDATLRLAGTVKDVGQAQARMENAVYGYVTPQTLVLLGEEPVLDQLELLVARDRFDRAHCRDVAERVRAVLLARGHPVRGISVPEPGKHPHADLTGLLLLALVTFALLVLLLSAALAASLMTTLMAAEVRQLGVMKALGGSRGQLARIYLAEALLLGLAAIAVGVGPGLWGGRAISRALALFLNFDLYSFSVPLWVFACVALAGIVAPLSVAGPVYRATAIPVVEALNDYGVAHDSFGAEASDRRLAALGGLARPLLLALRGALRRRQRTRRTLGTLALGSLFFMTALNVRASMIGTLDHLFATRRFDLSVSLAQPASAEQVARAVAKTPAIARAEGWIAVQAGLPPRGAAPDSLAVEAPAGEERIPLFGIPPETSMQEFDLAGGRALQPGDTDAVLVNAALASARRLHSGSVISLRVGTALRAFRVVGIAREAFSPPTAYVARDALGAGAPAGQSNSLRVAVRDGRLDEARDGLDRALDEEGARALSSTSKADARTGFDEHMKMIYVVLLVLSSIIAAVGGLGLLTTMSLSVLERRRELGVLRALGATPRTVSLLVVAEAIALTLASWAAAALLAWPVSKVLGGLLVMHGLRSGLDLSFDARGLGWSLVASLLLAVAGSAVPAWQASRSTVRAALASAP